MTRTEGRGARDSGTRYLRYLVPVLYARFHSLVARHSVAWKLAEELGLDDTRLADDIVPVAGTEALRLA